MRLPTSPYTGEAWAPQYRYRAAQGNNDYLRSSCEFVCGGAPRSESKTHMLAGGKHTTTNAARINDPLYLTKKLNILLTGGAVCVILYLTKELNVKEAIRWDFKIR